MNVVIKKTAKFDKVYKIAKSLPHYFNRQGLNSLKKDIRTHTLFGAFLNDVLIGFIAFKILNPKAVEISWMGVLPDYQNKGVGTRLLSESFKEIGGSYKVCEVKTLSDKDPDSAYAKTRNFYKKLGFIPIETIHPYPGWGKDNPCQIFVKFLSS